MDHVDVKPLAAAWKQQQQQHQQRSGRVEGAWPRLGGGASPVSAKQLSECRKSAGSPSLSLHVRKRRKNQILLLNAGVYI